MIIIFEGFDKSGKTTLANLLKQKYNFLYFKPTRQINSGLNLEQSIKYDWRFLFDFLNQNNVNVIIDRSFISQYVYSFILRRENILAEYSLYSEYDSLFIEYCEMLNNLEHLVVYCKRSDYTNATDDKVDININQDIKTMYDYFFDTYAINNLITCNFENGIDANFLKIEEKLNGKK